MTNINFILTLFITQFTQGQFLDVFKPVPPPVPIKGEWEIHSYLEDAGLTDHHILDACFDNQNILWVATTDGLARYDGYSWDIFYEDDGLPTNFIRCVLWTDLGLMVGTANGVGIFDWEQKSFDTFDSENHLPNLQIRRVIQDPDGTYWFCCDRWPNPNTEGGLTSWKDGKWKTYTTDDGLPTNYIQNYFRASDGSQFALTTMGLAQKQDDYWTVIPQGVNHSFWDAVEVDGVLFFSTYNSIYMQGNNGWKSVTPTNLNQRYILCKTSDGKVLTSAYFNSEIRNVLEWNGEQFQPVSPDLNHRNDYIEKLLESPDGSILLIGPDLVSSWQPQHNEWVAYDSLPKPSSVDSLKRVWFSGDSETYVKDGEQWYVSKQIYTNTKYDRLYNLWALSDNSVTYWNGDQFTLYTLDELQLESLIYFNIDHKNVLWLLGNSVNGEVVVKFFDGDTWQTKTHSLLQTFPYVSSAPDADGVYYVVKAGRLDHRVLKFDQNSSQEFIIPQKHRTIWMHFGIFVKDQYLWHFGTTGLHSFNRQTKQWNEIVEVKNRVLKYGLETKDAIWFYSVGLNNKGGSIISIQDGNVVENTILSITAMDNTNINELIYGGENSIFFIAEKTNWKPHQIKLPSNYSATKVVGTHQDVWINTGQYTMKYQPNQIKPKAFIRSSNDEVFQGSDVRISLWASIYFIPRTERSNFQYSWSLNDGAWSEYSYDDEIMIDTSNLEAGQYQLNVRALAGNFQTSLQPTKDMFAVLPIPLQDRQWFIPVVAILFSLLVSLVILTVLFSLKIRKYSLSLEQQVTERTNALVETEKQLMQAQKMEMIGQLAGGIAHDFNNLLLIIMGYADMLKNDQQIKPESRNALNLIYKSGEKAAYLTKQLLTFSRKQVSHPKVVNINEVILSIQPMVMRLIPERIECQFLLHEAVKPICIDPHQLEQVLFNLIINSRDAIKANGTITVETVSRVVYKNEQHKLFTISPGQYTILKVIDDGHGMDVDTQQKIFEPFFTTKEIGKGSGLGLSIIYGIAQQSNAQILVSSNKKIGTVISLYFPVVHELVKTEERLEDVQPFKGTETILLVDDDDAICNLIQSSLNKAGYKVLSYSNPKDVIERLDEIGPEVQILIVDVVMPEIGGIELFRTIHSKFPHIKVLYISGFPRGELEEINILKPGQYYLSKPFTNCQLLQTLRTILNPS